MYSVLSKLFVFSILSVFSIFNCIWALPQFTEQDLWLWGNSQNTWYKMISIQGEGCKHGCSCPRVLTCLNNNNNNSNKNNNNNKSFDLVDPGCVLLIRPLLPQCEYILCSFDVTLALIQTKFWLGQSRMSSFELLWIYLCGFKICLCVTWQTKYVLLRYNQIVFFQLQPDFIPLTK